MVQKSESCRKEVCGKDVRWILDGQNLPAISKALDVLKGPFGVGLMSLKNTGRGMMRLGKSRMK